MIEVTETSLKPFGYKIYVKLDEKIGEVGGIIIPDRYRVHGWNATVISIGNRVDNGLKSGDEILLLKSYTTVFNKRQDYAMTDSRLVMAKTILDGNNYYIQPINNFILAKPEKEQAEIGGIHLPDKSIKKAERGEVLRIGNDVKDVEAKPNTMIYYQSSLSIKCKENGEYLNLVSESDVEMVTYA